MTIDGTPHELAISPDRKTAYVPNYGDACTAAILIQAIPSQ